MGSKLKTKDMLHLKDAKGINVLKPDDKFCSQCALVLDQATAKTVESIKTEYMQVADLNEISEMKSALKQELEEIFKLKDA
jgi:uncharacterized protein YxjI